MDASATPAGFEDPERRSLIVLEWERIQEALAARCRSSPAARAARALEPFADSAESETHLAETQEILRWLEEGLDRPIGMVRDLSDVGEQLQSHAAIEPECLLAVASVLETASRARRGIEGAQELVPRIHALASSLVDVPDLRQEILRCIDPSGEIKDAASPQLAKARQRVASLAKQVRESIRKVVADPALEDVLQERFFTLREGRYVVPVKREARTGLRGIVHGRSSSGASFYVEPEAVVEANNEYCVAQAEEREEVARILRSLTNRVREQWEGLESSYRTLVHLDLLWAKGALAKEMQATVPEIVGGSSLSLPEARHPLLALRTEEKVIPNDLELGETASFLVVTGPNTGGKTVAMKTAGLAVLMARAGLAVPAGSKAKMTLFPRVLADLGDEQSLELHLSSFSGHLLRMQQIREHASPGTLVLLDEVVSGTDPREGAALARALLEDLAGRGACGIVTTHYPELKGLAPEDERFRNAGMEFDLDRMQPTFRMVYDLPGRSSALSVARKLGLDEEVVERAEELYGSEAARLDKLLDEVEALRIQVDDERAEAVRVRKQMERLEQEREREIERLRRKDREYLGEEEARLAEALGRARDEARRISKRLERETDRAKVEEARRRIKEIEEESRERLRRSKDGVAPGSTAPSEILEEGATVWLRRFNKSATVVGPPEKAGIPVAIGAIRMTVSVEEIELANKGRASSAPKPSPQPPTASRVSEIPFTHQLKSNTLDLRGQSVEEAIGHLDPFFDRCLKGRISPVIVIHGHGTGALRRSIREELANSTYVRGFREGKRGEGEDGVTVVSLFD